MQAQLNQLTKKNDNLQKDLVANGDKIYQNYEQQLDALQKEYKLNSALLNQRQKQLDATRENNALVKQGLINVQNGVATFSEDKINKGTLKTTVTKIALNKQGYQYDENGRYVDNAGILRNKNGSKAADGTQFGQVTTTTVEKKFDTNADIVTLLKNLTAQNDNGEMAYDVREQYQILTQLGLEEFMKYDKSGNQVYDKFGELTTDEMKSAVEAGITRIQDTANDINN